MRQFIIALAASLVLSCNGWGAEPPQTSLIYEVDPELRKPGQRVKQVEMDKLIAAINRRVNPSWLRGLFRKVRVRQLDERRIEITVPGDKPELAQRMERLLSHTGTIEFRILASTRKAGEKSIIDRARKDAGKVVKDAQGRAVAEWYRVAQAKKKDDADHVAGVPDHPDIVKRTVKRDGQDVPEVLVLIDVFNVNGSCLWQVARGTDHDGRICIDLTFNRVGGRLFGGLTEDNLPNPLQPEFTRKLGIILDGALYSAPSILTTIHDRAQITGSFTEQEVEDLVDVLNAGSLPTAIRKVEPSNTRKP